ncbi:RDD family protein [Kiloniella antarctica]|uniref:RDD family protein n=1 Tax=Kiloniella antarctica TaxID=1550907 RepID=A0ABW5BHN1_9PROT
MQAWYYWSNNTEFGPITKLQLFTLYQKKQIAGYNFVRPEGSEEWTSYKDLDIRQDDFSQKELEHIPPIKEKTITGQQEASNWRDETVHPWRRYFASWVDIFIYSNLIIYSSALVVSPDFFYGFLDQSSHLEFATALFLGQISLIALVLTLNTICMAIAGNTVGKFLFGIKVLDHKYKALNLSIAFKREWLILLKGLAFGIPIISLITQIYGYLDLTMQQTTYWDQHLNTVVVHRKSNTKQLILCLFGITVYFYLGYSFYLPYVIPI